MYSLDCILQIYEKSYVSEHKVKNTYKFYWIYNINCIFALGN